MLLICTCRPRGISSVFKLCGIKSCFALLPGQRKAWDRATVPGCYWRDRQKAQGLYFLSSLCCLLCFPFSPPSPLLSEHFLDFSSCFLSFQPLILLVVLCVFPLLSHPLSSSTSLSLTCVHPSPVSPSLSTSFLFLFLFYAILFSLPTGSVMVLETQQTRGERSPVVHVKAAAFPISPRVSVFRSSLCVCPSVALRVALPSCPAALPLRTPLPPVPLRAFQGSHKSFLSRKLVVSSGQFT